MNVLCIAKDFPAPGNPGAGIFVLRQAQALAARGHRIHVVRIVPHAPAWGDKWRAYRAVPQRDVVDGISVETLRAVVPPRMLGLEYVPLQVDRAMKRIVAAFAPDVIHAHFLLPSGQLAVRYGVPSVVTAHGSDAYDWAWRRPGLRRAAAQAIARADCVVAVSDFIARHVRALFDRDVCVVFNGADEHVFKPADKAQARAELGIEPERFTIAFAGRPSKAKGTFDLVEAMARIARLRPLLLCAGAGPETEAVAAAAGRLDADVRFCGMLDHDRLAQAMAACDVFCLPSYNEGLPVSICEAMLVGRPVVATPVGGIPEIVSEGVHGYLVAPGDPDALADRLAAIVARPDRAQDMGRAAHAFAQERLTWSVNARRYEQVYQRVCDAAA